MGTTGKMVEEDDTTRFTNLLWIKNQSKLFKGHYKPPYSKDTMLALESIESIIEKKMQEEIRVLRIEND